MFNLPIPKERADIQALAKVHFETDDLSTIAPHQWAMFFETEFSKDMTAWSVAVGEAARLAADKEIVDVSAGRVSMASELISTIEGSIEDFPEAKRAGLLQAVNIIRGML